MMGTDGFATGNGRTSSSGHAVKVEKGEAAPSREEISTCRSIAGRCVFIKGVARSGTTILAQIINAHDRAFLTTEANFYEAGSHGDFRAWYNEQHKSFNNQISKISYAPQFTFPGEHQWWEWLARAAEHFDVVGDKMAFNDGHFSMHDTSALMSFFESRFFESRYIFVFRDPVQTVLSSAVLWNKDPLPVIRAWASFVKLWADCIRIFPFTMTILHADLSAAKVAEIGTFLGLDLTESSQLLDAREQKHHNPADIERGWLATKAAPLLQMIFGEIKESLAIDRALLQADQKRGRLDFGPRYTVDGSSDIAVVSTSVGRAWNLADQLLNELQDDSAR